MVNLTAKERKLKMMDACMKVSTSIIKKKEKGYLHSKTVQFMMDNF